MSRRPLLVTATHLQGKPTIPLSPRRQGHNKVPPIGFEPTPYSFEDCCPIHWTTEACARSS